MTYLRIVVLSLLTAVTSAAHAEESTAITQLPQLDTKPVVEVSTPAMPEAAKGAPIKNFGVVVWKNPERGEKEGLVFRGGQPEGPEAYKFLGELGVKTIINLRTLRDTDQNLCAANGIECLDYSVIPVPGIKIHFHSNFKRAFAKAASEMEAGRKVFIYCQGGRHRTGALVSALTIRSVVCGKSYDKTELRNYMEKMLKDFGFYNLCGKALNSWANDIRGWAKNPEKNKWICE
ncbi:MAG TPA: hypothetical protein DCL44_00530 [Elusimicrobia bacterium]|nr:hypothetical protein [Elusimicrobiota bacterium]